MTNDLKKNIGVFLTRGYGLNSWKINGTLNRELDFIAVY